jgi:hypothetical protein
MQLPVHARRGGLRLGVAKVHKGLRTAISWPRSTTFVRLNFFCGCPFTRCIVYASIEMLRVN